MSIPRPACPACGAAFRPHFTVAGFEIERCGGCGLGRTVIPPGFDPSSIYDESYFQGGQADGYADYQGSRAELSREFRQVVQLLRTTGISGGRLLELGCAYGFFLDEAVAHFEVRGVELADHARQTCQARGLAVAASIEDPIVRAGAPFDAVVMLDVIEHLPNPGELLGQAAAMTRPGGRIVLTTGDFSAWVSRLMGSRWRLMTPPQHLWFFTPQALSRQLQQAGFEVESVTHPGKRVPLSLIAYQLGRMLGVRGGWRIKTSGALPVNLFDAMRVVARRV